MPGLWRIVRPVLAGWKKAIVNRPYGLKEMGSGSYFIRPWRLQGRPNIGIGRRTSILRGSNVCAIDRYDNYTFSPSLWIGDEVYIGPNVFLTAIDRISIGDRCVLSQDVYITDFFHGFGPEDGMIMKQNLKSNGPVTIGDDCFLGYRVAVMPNVTLGDWCIVGVNSVVTHSFPAYSMIAGTPARLIKVYSHELKEWVRPSIPAKD